MSWMLNILYMGLLVAWAPLLLFQRLRGKKKRIGWRAKFWGDVFHDPDGSQRTISEFAAEEPSINRAASVAWFHAVSVGEVRVLERLVGVFLDQHPDWGVVISTTSASGHKLALERFERHRCIHLPFDFSWAVKRALRQVQPKLFVTAELEIWPNLIRELHRRSTPIVVVNGRLSESSFRGYRRFSWLLRSTFAKLSLVTAQNDCYGDRFVELGVERNRVAVTGSMKFDGLEADRENPLTKRLSQMAELKPSDLVWLAGSTQPNEDRLVVSVYQKLLAAHPDLKLILVPRHPERFAEVKQELQASGLKWQARSCYQPGREWSVLLVDTVGELGAWWGTAAVAYVGGSMGSRGGQNMIEPAGFGAAVSFGPRTENFKETVEALLAHQAAQVVEDFPTMLAFVEQCLQNPSWRYELGERAQNWVHAQQGATQATLQKICKLIQTSSQTHSHHKSLPAA